MSKLDDAFIKAYQKIRGTKPDVSSSAPPDAAPANTDVVSSQGSEVWIDADGTQYVRPEDGVMNVASFIARTPDGRTRGTAISGGGGVTAGFSAPEPLPHGNYSTPHAGDSGYAIFDEQSNVGGPHFQPISLNLTALDLYCEASVQAAPAIAASSASQPAIGTIDQTAQATTAHIDRRDDRPIHSFEEVMVQVDASALSQATLHTGESVAAATLGVASRSAPVGSAEAAVTSPNPNRAMPQTWQPADLHEDSIDREILRTDISHDSLRRPTTEEPSEGFAGKPTEEAESAQSLSGEIASELEHVDGAEQTDIPEQELSKRSNANFAAAWEVDRFEFEPIIWELSSEASLLWQATEQLQLACEEGLRVLSLSSPAREQGRSTLAITISRMLAATGLKVILVDGDLDHPAIADKLQMEIALGWTDVMQSGVSVEEVAVHSVEDGFTVLPLAPHDHTQRKRPVAEATNAMIDQLRESFDLVLIDSGPINVVGGWLPGGDSPCQIDAALVIQDGRVEDEDAMNACLRRLNKLGIENIGLVENFS